MANYSFTLTKQSVRQGILDTSNGQVKTPCIVPLLKQGTFGPVDVQELPKVGVQMLAADGLELAVEPGLNILKETRGIGGFLNWHLPTLTFSGRFPVTDKLKKNASKLGFRYQEPITRADKRMDAARAAEIQEALAGDLAIAASQNVSYYAPVDDLNSAMKVNADLQAQEQALMASIIPTIIGGGIRSIRQQSIANWSCLPAALVEQLPDDDLEEWQRIVAESFELLPKQCLRIVVAGNADQLVHALCLGADLIITGLPLVDAVQGAAYTEDGQLRIKEAQYQRNLRMLYNHSAAYWHYLHHVGANAGTRGLTVNNLHCLLSAVDHDLQNDDGQFSLTKWVLTL